MHWGCDFLIKLYQARTSQHHYQNMRAYKLGNLFSQKKIFRKHLFIELKTKSIHPDSTALTSWWPTLQTNLHKPIQWTENITWQQLPYGDFQVNCYGIWDKFKYLQEDMDVQTSHRLTKIPHDIAHGRHYSAHDLKKLQIFVRISHVDAKMSKSSWSRDFELDMNALILGLFLIFVEENRCWNFA